MIGEPGISEIEQTDIPVVIVCAVKADHRSGGESNCNAGIAYTDSIASRSVRQADLLGMSSLNTQHCRIRDRQNRSEDRSNEINQYRRIALQMQSMNPKCEKCWRDNVHEQRGPELELMTPMLLRGRSKVFGIGGFGNRVVIIAGG